jgi:hypothetical protein
LFIPGGNYLGEEKRDIQKIQVETFISKIKAVKVMSFGRLLLFRRRGFFAKDAILGSPENTSVA